MTIGRQAALVLLTPISGIVGFAVAFTLASDRRAARVRAAA